MLQIQLNTACEGPLALNDLAFELCREFIQPDGVRFHTQVSRYCEYLARLAPRPEARAGDVLTLALPFLKAHGLTNGLLRDFSLKHLRLPPGAAAAYKFLHGFGFPIFAFSSGYRQFADAVATRLGFEAERVFGRELDLDRLALSPAEAEELRGFEADISAAPDLELPPGAASLTELPAAAQEAVARLDHILAEKIPGMEIGVVYREVEPLAAAAKAKALADSLAQTGIPPTDAIYVGASSSDVQALEAVRRGGGLTIAFNGDRQAVTAAEVVVVSDSAWPIALLTAILRLWGKDGVLEVAAPETRAKSRALVLPEEMIEPIVMGLQGRQFNLYLSGSPSQEKIIQESEAMQARLQGEAIATTD